MAKQKAGDTEDSPHSQSRPLEASSRLHWSDYYAGEHSGALLNTLRAERLHHLYANLPSALFISLLLALILLYVQWPVIAPEVLLGWFAVFMIILLGRVIMFFAWKRSVETDEQTATLRWLYRFRVGTALAGVVWGIAGVLLAPPGNISHTVYVTFALAGLGAGGSTTLAIDRISVNVFLLSVLSPQIIYLALEQSTITYGMSAMLVLFLLFLLASAWQLRLRLEENIYLQHTATESEARIRQMLEGSPIATRIVDAASNEVLFANQSYISLIESSPEQVIGLIPSNYYAHPEEYEDAMEQVRKGENITNKLVELRLPNKDTWKKWALATYLAVEYQNRPAILGWFYDITDHKLMEEKIEYMAYHDNLTDLPNRYLFRDRLEQAIATTDREQSSLALLFVDLDKFKPVNDQYGHDIGDLLLIAVADRIRGCLRKTDSAARLGGDEFVILLPSIKSEENATRIAESIRSELERTFNIEGLTLDISSSTGIAIYPVHAKDGRQLIRNADIAMYYAKAEGRNRVNIYNPGMREKND